MTTFWSPTQENRKGSKLAKAIDCVMCMRPIIATNNRQRYCKDCAQLRLKNPQGKKKNGKTRLRSK